MNPKQPVSVTASLRTWAYGLCSCMFLLVAFLSGLPNSLPRTLRVGVYQNEPKIFMDQNGRASGIFIELLNDMAVQEGWTIVYVRCEWVACLQALADGRIDLMPDVAYSVERDANYDFHKTPVLESWSSVYAHSGTPVNNFSQLDGRRVAVLDGSIQQTDFSQMMQGFGFKTILVPADTLEQVFDLASKGLVDAGIANNFFGDYFYQKYGLVKTTIVFDPTSLYFATAQGRNPDLLDAIDRHLGQWLQQPNSTYYTVLGHWVAKPPANRVPQYLIWMLAIILGLLLAVVGVALLLRRQVRMRTLKLHQSNSDLQESEQRYQTLASISPVGIFRTDSSGATTYVNPKWCAISGLSVDQALGNGWLQAVDPVDREKLSRGWQAAAQLHQASFSDYRFIRPDGTIAWVMGQAVPEKNSEDQIVGYVGTITDITDRKQAEAALQSSEQQLSLIYANISEVLIYLAVEAQDRFRFVSVNPAFLKVTGLTDEQVIGKLVQDVVPEPAQALVLGNYKKAILTKKTVGWEEISVYPAGKKYGEVSITPILDPGGNCTHLIGTVHDITERKQAEARILHINRLYATLSQLNQAIVQASDRQALLLETCRVAVEYGQFRLAWIGLIDPAAQCMTPFVFAGDENGYLSNLTISYQDEELGRGPTGTAIREGRCVLCQDIATDPHMGPWRASALKRGLRSSAAVPIRQADQIIGALTVYAGEPHLFDAEEVALLVKIGQTISYALDGLTHEAQRCQAEAELKELNAQLEQRVEKRTAQLESANKELESFSYSVSHDLRAPLRAISGFSEIIARRHQADLNEEGRHYIDNIVQASAHMGHLIDDLLTFSRLGRTGVRREPVPLASLVNEISRNMQSYIAEIQGTLFVSENLPTVTGDRTLLNQVFSNLLENAFKYHRSEVPPQVSLVYFKEDNDIIVKVSDNGIGIPLEYQDKIFNVFQRLHSEEEYPGTGIGLATVRKSISLLGGSVWVESKVNEGSIFFVRLPKE